MLVNIQEIKGEKGTGYEGEAGKGSFSCDNCEYWRESDTSCGQKDMMAKSQLPRTRDGRVIVDPKGCCEFVDRKGGKKMKKHGFSHTHVDIHNDGSATIHHVHESGDPLKDVHHAVADLDGIHDSLEDHLNPDEEKEHEEHEALEEAISPGIHEKMEKMGKPEGY